MKHGEAGKGDKRRPINKQNATYPNEIDMGSIGCKNMDVHVYRGTKKCIYCKKPEKEKHNGTS